MNKKGLGFGIPEWGSWIVFPFIPLIFFFVFKFSFGTTVYKIEDVSGSLEDKLSLLNIIKTPLEFRGEKASLGQLLIVYGTDFELYEAKIVPQIQTILDSSFSMEKCHLVCINDKKIFSSSCKEESDYFCSGESIEIIDISGKKISIRLITNEDIESNGFFTLA